MLVVILAAACREPGAGGRSRAAQPPPAASSSDALSLAERSPAAQPSPAAPPSTAGRAIDDAQLGALLRESGTGAVLVTDVATGRVVASAASGRELAAPVMSLSVIKLYVAALWWEHGRGDGDFVVRDRHVTVRDMLIDGWDRPGEEMAVALRRELGAAAMLAALRGYGLDGLALPADADDARWGSALSIGEHDVRVTLAQVARFLGAIGGGSRLLAPETQRRLQSALRDAVERGTAKSAGARLAGLAWQLGGKTGTGPVGADPHDGWFAGLIFDRGAPRYAIAVYIERRGLGGGVAAGLAAEVTRQLAAAR